MWLGYSGASKNLYLRSDEADKVPWRVTRSEGCTYFLQSDFECPGDFRCDWWLSFGGHTVTLYEAESDRVPWKFVADSNGADQFYLQNKWNCPGDSRCDKWLSFQGEQAKLYTNFSDAVPWKVWPAELGPSPPEGPTVTFNGNYIETPGPIYDDARQLTVEFWAKRTEGESDVAYFHGTKHQQYPGMVGHHSGEDLRWAAGGGLNYPNEVKGTASLPLDTWAHFAFVKDADENRMTVYINGEPAIEAIGGTDRQAHDSPVMMQKLRFGTVIPGAFIPSWMNGYGFIGEMTGIRAWNTARTQQEIQDAMNVANAGLVDAPGLVMYGPENGDLVVSSPPPPPASPAQAMAFDGTGKVNVGDVDALNGLQVFTGEAWVKFDSAEDFRRVFSKVMTDNKNGFDVYTERGEIAFNPMNEANVGVKTTGDRLVTGTWMHIAVVFDGTQTGNAERAKIYIDGVEAPTVSWGVIPDSLPSTTAPLYLGAWGDGSRSFLGQLDEVRFWTVKRTAAEIQANMSCELSGDEAGLAAYYNFNSGSDPVEDSSGNGNAGTPEGGATYVDPSGAPVSGVCGS